MCLQRNISTGGCEAASYMFRYAYLCAQCSCMHSGVVLWNRIIMSFAFSGV